MTENNFSTMYLYLDFGGYVENDVFENPVHLRVVNLHKETPLVQLNERVFRGTFDMAVGTNMFFELSETPTQSDLFGRKPPINLKFFTCQNKILNLEPVKIKPKKPEIQQEQMKIKYNLQWDYETLLKKWDEGTLELRDIIKDTIQPVAEKVESVTEEMESSIEVPEPKPTNIEKNVNKEDQDSMKELQDSYQKLKQLCSRPVRRKIFDEIVEECDIKYKKSYEIHNLQKQFLQPSDAFGVENFIDINENTISECINIDRCILYGMLDPSTVTPRILTDKEKRDVLNLCNLDNLSLSARYFVINNIVMPLEKQLETLSQDKLEQTDEFGRTPVETLEIYKEIQNILGRRIAAVKLNFLCSQNTVESSTKNVTVKNVTINE